MSPEVFNRVEVWRLGWPKHDNVFMVFKPLSGLLGLVFWVIILLKNDISHLLTPNTQDFVGVHPPKSECRALHPFSHQSCIHVPPLPMSYTPTSSRTLLQTSVFLPPINH